MHVFFAHHEGEHLSITTRDVLPARGARRASRCARVSGAMRIIARGFLARSLSCRRAIPSLTRLPSLTRSSTSPTRRRDARRRSKSTMIPSCKYTRRPRDEPRRGADGRPMRFFSLATRREARARALQDGPDIAGPGAVAVARGWPHSMCHRTWTRNTCTAPLACPRIGGRSRPGLRDRRMRGLFFLRGDD